MKCKNCGNETHKLIIFGKGGNVMEGCPQCAELAERQRNCATWPKESWAMGVHPKQVDKMIGLCKKYGVPTEFNRKTGNPILTSALHRKKYGETFQFYDQNAGYSDPAPKNCG